MKFDIPDFPGAISDFSKSIEMNPHDADAYYNRGSAKIQLGQIESGRIDIKKASELGSINAKEEMKFFRN